MPRQVDSAEKQLAICFTISARGGCLVRLIGLQRTEGDEMKWNLTVK
jgi:hypothetical protein